MLCTKCKVDIDRYAAWEEEFPELFICEHCCMLALKAKCIELQYRVETAEKVIRASEQLNNYISRPGYSPRYENVFLSVLNEWKEALKSYKQLANERDW